VTTFGTAAQHISVLQPRRSLIKKTDIHYEFERMEEKLNIHITYDVAQDILTDKAQFHSQWTSPYGICGGQSDA
jgi:hypothetical protein